MSVFLSMYQYEVEGHMSHIILQTLCKLVEIFEYKDMKDGDLTGSLTPCILNAQNMTQKIEKCVNRIS